jgi:hypothetical protein
MSLPKPSHSNNFPAISQLDGAILGAAQALQSSAFSYSEPQWKESLAAKI